VHYAEVRAALEARDRQDRERATAPLRQASDAVYVDTSDLTIRQAVDVLLALAEARATSPG
jgi:CMP/dCMP kinase